MKVHIMTDLEGPAGVNGRGDGIGNKIINTETACKCLVEEVNACCEGLVEAGATEIVVWDGHGGSNSIDIRLLHPAASLGILGGGLAPVCCYDGCDAAIQLGAHAMQGVRDGFMNHSFNSHGIAELRLNGEPVGEIGIGMLLAAHFGVPTILVSGDVAACREAEAFAGAGLCTVATKQALSRYKVINRPLEGLYAELRAVSANALRNLKQAPLQKIAPSYELIYRAMCPNLADAFERAGIERLDYQTLRFRSGSIVDLWAQACGWAPGVHNRKFNIQ
jgi:D-amino peptidase